MEAREAMLQSAFDEQHSELLRQHKSLEVFQRRLLQRRKPTAHMLAGPNITLKADTFPQIFQWLGANSPVYVCAHAGSKCGAGG